MTGGWEMNQVRNMNRERKQLGGFTKTPELEPPYQVQFCVILRTPPFFVLEGGAKEYYQSTEDVLG